MTIITTTISVILSLYPKYDDHNYPIDTFYKSKILKKILDEKFTYYDNKWFENNNNNSSLERVEIEEDYVYYYIFYDYLPQLNQYLTNNEKYKHIQIRPNRNYNKRYYREKIVDEWQSYDIHGTLISSITTKEKLEIELQQKKLKIINYMSYIISGFYTIDNIDLLFKNLKVLYKYN